MLICCSRNIYIFIFLFFLWKPFCGNNFFFQKVQKNCIKNVCNIMNVFTVNIKSKYTSVTELISTPTRAAVVSAVSCDITVWHHELYYKDEPPRVTRGWVPCSRAQCCWLIAPFLGALIQKPSSLQPWGLTTATHHPFRCCWVIKMFKLQKILSRSQTGSFSLDHCPRLIKTGCSGHFSIFTTHIELHFGWKPLCLI